MDVTLLASIHLLPEQRQLILIRAGGRLTLSGVIVANMGCELFVALQLEVAHHFSERRAGRRSRRFEPPATFGATKTPKTLLLDPYQFPAHGGQILQAANLDGL
jgi:hypothetical protein